VTWQAWAAVVAFAGAYVLIATEVVRPVASAVGGAIVMFLLGAATDRTAFFDEMTGIDWNVIFLLLGMMLIVAVLKQTGIFEYLAIWSAKRARGRPFSVLVILIVVTAVASAALDNVTTVLLVAPVTFLVCERLNLKPVPFIIAEVLASNIGGTATLIGDPPNIIISQKAHITFNDFLVNMAPLVVLLILVLVAMCRFMFRESFRYDPKRAMAIMALRERDAIKNKRLLVMSLAVLAAVLAGFTLQRAVGISPSIVAMIGGLVLFAASRLPGERIAREIEWETLVFFAGLFIMVGALVSTGVIGKVSDAATGALGDNVPGATMLLLWGSTVLSAIVNNIPYVATMSPIVEQLAHHAGDGTQSHVLWWALAFGADLGGNATAIGASANVVALGIAARSGHRISFWQFTKYGLLVTVVSVAMVTVYLWLRYLAWG
jgi:Na+/H+ antiporter NhaD/arsenite permease-like protein